MSTYAMRAHRALRVAERDKQAEPYLRFLREQGRTIVEIAPVLTALNVPTERGKPWRPNSVFRSMRRLGMPTRLHAA